jgi:hypothetical protein
MPLVYRFALYDIRTDACITSARMGTKEAIKNIGGFVIDENGMEVDNSKLHDCAIDGLTAIGCAPSKLKDGIQQQVTS